MEATQSGVYRKRFYNSSPKWMMRNVNRVAMLEWRSPRTAKVKSVPDRLALSKSNANFANPKGNHLFDRLQDHYTWIEARIARGVFPYARTLADGVNPEAKIGYLRQKPRLGINLAVQDYLALASHEEIRSAARSAIDHVGVHSAGSPMLLGNSLYSQALEEALSSFVAMNHILLFPTGWAAGYGCVKALIRPGDHIVMDTLAHACLQEGASAATQNILRYDHLNVDHAILRIAQAREASPDSAVLVIAEGLYSMDSDIPDIRRLQEACRSHGAQLLLDVARDLGSLGPQGTGALGLAGMLGEVDIVIGAFSKTFASNGGFVATNDPRVKSYLRWFANPHTFSNALSPIQCAVVTKAIEIVRSPEGEARRAALLHNATFFRSELQRRGCSVLGQPSAIVPVLVGRESTARLASRELNASGTFANLVEFPAVGLRQARFRCQLMASHTESQLAIAALSIASAIEAAEELARPDLVTAA